MSKMPSMMEVEGPNRIEWVWIKVLSNIMVLKKSGWHLKTVDPESDYNHQKCPDLFPPNFVIIIPTDVKSITVAIE